MTETEGCQDNVEQNIISEEELHGDKPGNIPKFLLSNSIYVFICHIFLPNGQKHNLKHTLHQVKCIRPVCGCVCVCGLHCLFVRHWPNTELSENLNDFGGMSFFRITLYS